MVLPLLTPNVTPLFCRWRRLVPGPALQCSRGWRPRDDGVVPQPCVCDCVWINMCKTERRSRRSGPDYVREIPSTVHKARMCWAQLRPRGSGSQA